jgi:nucleoside-diphosphate-sugar epimerase
MRVAVTGATGFIGQALCAALSAAGHRVVPCDLRRGVGLGAPQAVVHLAGIAHRRGVSEDDFERVNVVLAREVGRAAAAAGARMVYLSSVKVHGDESAEPLTEASPLAPSDAYARSKVRAEEALRAVAGLQLAILRPVLVYGPHVRANFRALMRAVAAGIPLPLAGIGNQRSLLYVGNLCDAILRLLPAPRAATYLLCDGPALSTPQLCNRLGEALGTPARLFTVPGILFRPIPAAKALTRSMVVDDSALRRDLHWNPPHSTQAGLAATAQWYLRKSRNTA